MFAPKNKWLCYITCIVHFVFSVVLCHYWQTHVTNTSASFWYTHYQYVYIGKKLLVRTSSIYVHKKEASGTYIINTCTKARSF